MRHSKRPLPTPPSPLRAISSAPPRLRPLYGAVLMLFATSAQSLTIIEPSSTNVTVSGDTSYRINAGTVITAPGNSVTVNGTDAVTLSNAGTVAGTVGGAALQFNVPATFTNELGASVIGVTYGVNMSGSDAGASNVVNRGDISSSVSHAIYYGGAASGAIDNYGTLNGGAAGDVGNTADGIQLATSGNVVVTNRAGASIVSGKGDPTYGTAVLVSQSGDALIQNAGTIDGYLAGIRHDGGGTVHIDNAATGTIRAAIGAGVRLNDGDALVNRGEISSAGGAAIQLDGNNNDVVLGAGSVLNDNGTAAIVSHGVGNTLRLIESGSEDGNITASAGHGLAELTADAGSDWTLGGNITLGGDSGATLGVNGRLTLGGTVSQDGGGGTTIGGTGQLTVGRGGTSGMIDGNIANAGALVFDRRDSARFDGVLSGSGSLTQVGAGTMTLTAAGSSQGAVKVEAGTLAFAQAGDFRADTYTTGTNATTSIAADATLDVAGNFTQAAGSTLSVTLGAAEPVITANRAALGGSLSVSGLSAKAPESASALAAEKFRVLQTSAGISGDFDHVSFSETSPVNYLTIDGAKSSDDLGYDVGFDLAWRGDTASGNGLFTLADASDTFDLDVQLADRTGSFSSGWDGRTLTKKGAGTLVLSEAAAYTGDTIVGEGTMRTDVADAVASSGHVSVANGATLDLNGFDQQIQHLNGAGNIALGGATLDLRNTDDSVFNGAISGAGTLHKRDAGSLTLGGVNVYDGGTVIHDGRLIGTSGAAFGSGAIDNGATLQLDFASDSTLTNVLGGSGTLGKTGAGTATLNAAGSTQGAVAINAGELRLAQDGAFRTTGDFTVYAGGTVSLAEPSTLEVGNRLSVDGTLNVVARADGTAITAQTAHIGGGASFNLTGYSAAASASASELAEKAVTVIHTTDANGLTGGFQTATIAGSSSPADFLTLGGTYTEQDFTVGLGLTWYASHGTSPQAAHGVFTLTEADGEFDIDAVLADQDANRATGWDGKSLTKQGAGTLQLSKQNTYTGDTRINEGTLRTGVADALASSAHVSVADGATFDLNGFDQHVNNLSGAGRISLGSAALDLVNTGDTAFDGTIDGTGGLRKSGAGTLTLGGVNTYSGGTVIDDGRLIATSSAALGSGAIDNAGTLQLDFAGNGTLASALMGAGTLTKTGAGTATLSGTGSSQGAVAVNGGELRLAQAGAFRTTGDFTVAAGATASVDAQSTLDVGNRLSVDGTLNVVARTDAPAITAGSAQLGVGSTFNLVGFSASETASASELASQAVTVIHTTGPGGIAGAFQTVNVAGSSSPADFLMMGGTYTGQDFVAGLGLTWYGAHSTAPEQAHGTFTLTQADGEFDIDAVLADQDANRTTGWDGRSLTKDGAGTLQLSKQNTYTGATSIRAGTLRAGADNVIAASEHLDVASGATFDLNGFDQIANNLSGAGNIALGTGSLTVSNSADTAFAGHIDGTGGLTKTGGASLMLSADQTYGGETIVDAGALLLGQGARLSNTSLVTVAQGATFGGDGGIGGSAVNHGVLAVGNAAPGTTAMAPGDFLIGGSLVNDGEIRMASATPSSTLTVNGDYTGNNGMLTLNTTLGGDASPTDRLVVHGNTAGQTTLHVRNAGGFGGQTVDGIRVVQVDGQSNGVFALDGRLVAGAYDYKLYQGGLQSPGDGDWYLRSTESAVPRPETGVYLANQGAAQTMFLQTMHDRAGFADPVTADSKAARRPNVWTRVTGGRTLGTASNGSVDQSADSAVMQAGIDLLNRTSDNRRLQAGVMAGYGMARTHAESRGYTGPARGTVNGGSAGVYGTWRGNAAGADGPYVDAWAQYGHFGNTVQGTDAGEESYSSRTLTASVEGGWAIPVSYTDDGDVLVEPQLQLIYTNYRADDHRERNGTLVQGRNGGGLTTRLGVRLYHAPDPDTAPTWLPYAEVNWWHNADQNAIAFDNDLVTQGGPGNRGEVKAGVQAQLGKRWRVWGDVALQRGGDGYKSIAGLLGARYMW